VDGSPGARLDDLLQIRTVSTDAPRVRRARTITATTSSTAHTSNPASQVREAHSPEEMGHWRWRAQSDQLPRQECPVRRGAVLRGQGSMPATVWTTRWIVPPPKCRFVAGSMLGLGLGLRQPPHVTQHGREVALTQGLLINVYASAGNRALARTVECAGAAPRPALRMCTVSPPHHSSGGLDCER
jgi:hypothetical protein